MNREMYLYLISEENRLYTALENYIFLETLIIVMGLGGITCGALDFLCNELKEDWLNTQFHLLMVQSYLSQGESMGQRPHGTPVRLRRFAKQSKNSQESERVPASKPHDSLRAGGFPHSAIGSSCPTGQGSVPSNSGSILKPKCSNTGMRCSEYYV